MLLRLLGLVYAVAFLVAANQLVPLIGSDGLLPVGRFLERIRQATGSATDGFLHLPTLFWFGDSDTALLAVAWTGFALACVVAAGFANALLMLALWFLYLSIVHVGQDWYGYGWEVQLLETGFLAVFLCPLLDARPFPRRAPPTAILWLFRWLIFRIMFGAGLIKVRGDPAWRDLTALDYHFETQPIPNGLSRWFHFLPRPWLRLGVLFNHVAELVAPLFVFWPRRLRRVAGVVIIGFQGAILLGGNLSFLNWLTVVPALACLDDAVWARLLPRALVRRAGEAAARTLPPTRTGQIVARTVVAAVALLSIQPTVNLLSSGQVMNTSFDPLELVNTYGAFGTVGRTRENLVFEGTDSPAPDDPAAAWREYLYRGLPVDEHRRPPQIAPYQLRLDWQLWFAAMGSPAEYPWTLHLVWKLLHDDPAALRLFASNPFPAGHPPRYVRVVLYRYRFAPPGDPAGRWWTRERLGLWLPPLSADDPRLRAILQTEGWLPGSPADAP